MERTTGRFKDERQRIAETCSTPTPALESSASPVMLTDAERRRHARIQSGSLAVHRGRRRAHPDVLRQDRAHPHPGLRPDCVHAGAHRRTLPAHSPAPLHRFDDCRPADVRHAVRSFLCLLQPGRRVHVRNFPSIPDTFAACSNQVRLRAERVRQTTQNVLPEEKTRKGYAHGSPVQQTGWTT